jgi:hypothetical protein
MHRHDVQWTQSFVVELAAGTAVTLDDENRDFAMVPLDSIGEWLETHDTCALATARRRVAGGDDDLARAFERGTLGELKADSLRRLREALLARRRQGHGGGRSTTHDGEL